MWKTIAILCLLVAVFFQMHDDFNLQMKKKSTTNTKFATKHKLLNTFFFHFGCFAEKVKKINNKNKKARIRVKFSRWHSLLSRCVTKFPFKDFTFNNVLVFTFLWKFDQNYFLYGGKMCVEETNPSFCYIPPKKKYLQTHPRRF